MGYITLLINHHWVLAPHKHALADATRNNTHSDDRLVPTSATSMSPVNILSSPTALSSLVAKLNEIPLNPPPKYLRMASQLIVHIRNILEVHSSHPFHTYNARLALLYLIRIQHPSIRFPALFYLFHSLDSFPLMSDEISNLLCLLESLFPYLPPLSHSLDTDKLSASIAIQIVSLIIQRIEYYHEEWLWKRFTLPNYPQKKVNSCLQRLADSITYFGSDIPDQPHEIVFLVTTLETIKAILYPNSIAKERQNIINCYQILGHISRMNPLSLQSSHPLTVQLLQEYKEEESWFAGKKAIQILATAAFLNAECLLAFLQVLEETHTFYWEWTYLMVLYLGAICQHSEISSIRKLAFRETTKVQKKELHGLMHFVNYSYEHSSGTPSSWKIRTATVLALMELIRNQEHSSVYRIAFNTLENRKKLEPDFRLSELIQKGLKEITVAKVKRPGYKYVNQLHSTKKKPRHMSYFSYLIFSVCKETSKLVVESHYRPSVSAKRPDDLRLQISSRQGRIAPPNSESSQIPPPSVEPLPILISPVPKSSQEDQNKFGLSVEPYHRNFLKSLNNSSNKNLNNLNLLCPSSLQDALSNGGEEIKGTAMKPLYTFHQPGSLNRRKLYAAPIVKRPPAKSGIKSKIVSAVKSPPVVLPSLPQTME